MDYKVEDMSFIWTSVARGVGGHGSFLTNFAATWTSADHYNKHLLKEVSENLIKIYKLHTADYIH